MIETRRLRLLPASLQALRAELASPGELAAVLRMETPGEWPPELYDRDAVAWTIRQLEADPGSAEWWVHYFVRKGEALGPDTIIGCGGFKGSPANGMVEIGYSILPDYRRQGYASEAAAALAAHAFVHPEVSRVQAETLPALTASIGVLERCGFRYAGPGSGEGVVRYELRREDWERLATRRAVAPSP